MEWLRLLVCTCLACGVLGTFPAQMEMRRDYVAHYLGCGEGGNDERCLSTQAAFSKLSEGKYTDALTLYDTKLADGSNILQKRVKVADIYINKAMAYSKMGQHHYSLKFLNQALSIKEDVLGATSFAVAGILNNIASVYADRASRETLMNADRQEAIDTYTRALNIFLREPSTRRGQGAASTALQIQHNQTIANTYHNMGIVLSEMGKFHESTYHYGRAVYLQNNTETVGPWSHALAETYYYLGACYDKQEKWESALDAYVKAAKIDLSIAGYDTERLEPVTYGMTLFRRNQGKTALAIEGLITTLNRKLYSLGSTHMSTAVTYMLMGGAYEESYYNFTEAAKFYAKAQEVLVTHLPIAHDRGERHAFDSAHVLTMDIYNKMGLCQERLGRLVQAQNFFTDAVAITDGIHISEDSSHWNRSAAARAHILGRTYTGADAYDTAANSGYAANVYSNRAHVSLAQGLHQSAMDDCDLSTAVRLDEFESQVCDVPCNDHGAVGWNYYLKARADRAMNDGNSVANDGCDADTKAIFEDARDIFSVVLGNRHLTTQAVRNEISTCV